MLKINIDNKDIFCEENQQLSDILIKNGFKTEHPCGGKGICKKCFVKVNGEKVLSCQYKVTEPIRVETIINESIESETGALSVGKIDAEGELHFSLDIGTTTLALALINLSKKEIIEVKTADNPQRIYGADIMSRIDYCNKNSVEALQVTLIEALNKLIDDFNLKEDIDLTVSANVTMLHMFFGVSPQSIGIAPYEAVFLDYKKSTGEALGLKKIKNVTSLPSIHSFVGADLVAGLNYIGYPKDNKFNLLIDLGTNAEIVLFNKDFAISTAAAAGPCFEGANIDCGMSATKGAVSSFTLKDGTPKIVTIGKAPPTGICGTGLVDIISELLRNNLIDETGSMDKEKFNLTDDVYISQKDVRQYQLAKSAVYSGILSLMELKNVAYEDIENMYISGGFSAKINIDNAVFTGLLPKELKEKCKAINNSSLLGNIKYLFEKNDLSIYLKNAEYVDLSLSPVFSNLFIENMEF